MKQKTEDLYNVKDVKRVRELLLKEQDGYDLLTLSEVLPNQSVLDHNHKNLFVRGVLNRATNSMVGKIENAFNRYMKHWYSGTISNFLRQCAEYLERKDDTRFRHTQWIKDLKVQFNKLNEAQKAKIIVAFGSIDGKNGKARKEIFAKIVLDRELGYEVINNKLKEIINGN